MGVRIRQHITVPAPRRDRCGIAKGIAKQVDTFEAEDECSLLGFCRVNKRRYPSVYYEIEVRRGRERRTCFRRYSQFCRLASLLDPDGKRGLRRELPRKTCALQKEDVQLNERMAELDAFLTGLLGRVEYVGNPVIEQFLEQRSLCDYDRPRVTAAGVSMLVAA